jgi:hypothetical protein
MEKINLIVMFLLMWTVPKAQPCYPTPYFATGGNWFIPTTTIPQEFCFLNECAPIAGVSAIDMDAVGYKQVRVVAPQAFVSAVFVNYQCDTVLSVQCDGVISDTAYFKLDYQPQCLVFFLVNTPDTLFVLPGPDTNFVQPQPYPCSVVAIDPDYQHPLTYRQFDPIRGTTSEPSETQPQGMSLRSDGAKVLRQGLPDSLIIIFIMAWLLHWSWPWLKTLFFHRE